MPATVNRILVDIGGDSDDDHEEGGSLSGSVFVTCLAYLTIALFLFALVANLFLGAQVEEYKTKDDKNVLLKILLFIVNQTGILLDKIGVRPGETGSSKATGIGGPGTVAGSKVAAVGVTPISTPGKSSPTNSSGSSVLLAQLE